jgi:hypothetical protein
MLHRTIVLFIDPTSIIVQCNMTVPPSSLPAPIQGQARPADQRPARGRARKITVALIPAVEESVAPAAKEIVMEEQIKTASDQTRTMFTDAAARSQGAMDRGTKVFDEMGEFSRGNLEAIAESGRIMARGVEAMGQEAAAFAKRAYESQLAAFRTLSAVKNPTDLFKIQGDLVRKSFDAAVAETSRNTEATLKLAGEVAQPLQNRLALAAEKIKTAA